MLSAVGTSLVAVSAFGATTAANYALSGLIDWRIAALFVAGGLAGGALGVKLGGSFRGGRTRCGSFSGSPWSWSDFT